MWLDKLDLDLVQYVCRNLRDADRAEAHAVRFDDSDDSLAMEISTSWGTFGWAAGLEQPIAVIGASQIWPGFWSAWMLATDEFPRIGLPLTKFVKRRMIPMLFKELGLRRGEARSSEQNVEAHRWLETLGAVRESTLVRYGKNGEDFHIYRWDNPDVY
jgi:RimJ/RimL family protein N-acetyltransferase